MSHKNIVNTKNGFETIPVLRHETSFFGQKALVSCVERNCLPQSETEERNEILQPKGKHERDEKTKELLERLSEYEQEIYEKDRLIQQLQHYLDLHREIVEKWQCIQLLSLRLELKNK